MNDALNSYDEYVKSLDVFQDRQVSLVVFKTNWLSSLVPADQVLAVPSESSCCLQLLPLTAWLYDVGCPYWFSWSRYKRNCGLIQYPGNRLGFTDSAGSANCETFASGTSPPTAKPTPVVRPR